MRIIFKITIIFLLLFSHISSNARTMIRDAEIEMVLQNILDPILKSAGKKPDEVKLYVILDPTVNAFVTGGQNIFLHTGLIERLETPEQLAGVLAHELGHITGGHLLRSHDASRNAGIKGILTSAAIGIAAIISGGGGGALAGGLIAGQQAGIGHLLQFSKTQEAAADQAALEFLNKSEIGAQGLAQVMQMLSQNEFGLKDYMRSHPLSRDRIALLENIGSFPVFDRKLYQHKYDRIKAKISAFLGDPIRNLLKDMSQKPQDISILYKTISLHKNGNGREAYIVLKEYIDKHPDVFMEDLAGQIAFETGQIDKSITHYQNIYDKIPSPLIAFSFSQSLISSENAENIKKAIPILKRALLNERFFVQGYKNLAIAYDRIGKNTLSKVATAQYYFYRGEYNKALKHAKDALENLPIGSNDYIQVEDIVIFSEKKITADNINKSRK